MRPNPMENQKIKQEMDELTRELEQQGIYIDTKQSDMIGLGDVVEKSLQKIGITQDRFKEWFGLRACRCDKRKLWLNNLLTWEKK